MLASLNYVKMATQALKTKYLRKAEDSISKIDCTVPIWIQFKEHKAVFEIVRKKMKSFNSYYNSYNDALKQFKDAVIDNNEMIGKWYKKMWQIILEFFGSKEYLASYNPAFLHTKGRKERDETIDELFEIKEIDLEREFYEIVLHLLYKQLLSEKYGNLMKLQRIIRIERKWKSLLKKRKTS